MAGLINVDSLKGIGDIIPGIASGIGGLAKDIRTAITGVDTGKREEILAKLAEIESSANLAQLEINKIEAQSENLFKSGWRPGLAWCCVFTFVLNYIIKVIAQWILTIANTEIILPTMDVSEIIPVLFALLGMGGLRTYEKIKK